MLWYIGVVSVIIVGLGILGSIFLTLLTEGDKKSGAYAFGVAITLALTSVLCYKFLVR